MKQPTINTMRTKLIIVLSSIIALSSCTNKELPSPVISFQSTINELLNKETNKLINLSNDSDTPGTMGHTYKMKTIKYLTSSKDTITYHFAGQNLLSICISLPNTEFNQILESFKTNNKFKEIEKTCFEDENKVIIKVGKESSNNFTTLLYLNNEDNEITSALNSIKTINTIENMDYSHFYATTLLHLMGTADAANLFNGLFFSNQTSTYYNNALRTN